MADDSPNAGWTTVHLKSQAHPDRLPPAHREVYEKSKIREWETSSGHWSGIGKHPDDFTEAKKIHSKIIAPKDNDLGMGTFGRVERVTHRTVRLARKWIKPQRNQDFQTLRREALAMERLDHDHIVKLIGTYTFKRRELYLLIWPVAVCNLDELLTDLADLKSGQGDREDILKRFEELDIADVSLVESRGRHDAAEASKSKCPLNFLQRIMGCVAQAVTHCHASKVRHLDLKPSNILLNPNKVYLADFGIARDFHDQENTATMGLHGTPKWRPPEAYIPEEYSTQCADIYSLGLIYLNIATLVYHGDLNDFHSVVADLLPHSRAEKLKAHQQNLALHALATQCFHDEKRPTVAPRHILGLAGNMVSSDPRARPRADQVDQELVDLGGIEQVYHNSCCRKSARHVGNRIDERLAAAAAENARLKPENERLQKEVKALRAMDETYRLRLENQEKKHARDTELLTKQRDEERQKRRKLEERVNELEMQSRRHNRTGLPRPDANIDHRFASNTAATSLNYGLGITNRPRTHPLPQAAIRPPPSTNTSCSAVPRPTPSTRVPSGPHKAWVTPNVAVMSGGSKPDPVPQSSDTPSPNPQRSGTLSSRGSNSRLPILAKLPATPRSSTPRLARDPSLTDSTQASMSSSLFSARSFETSTETFTPPAVSPAMKQADFHDVVRETADTKPSFEPSSPTQSVPPSMSSALSSPRTTKVELASVAGSEISRDGLGQAKIPSFQPTKSWAAVAGESHALAKMVGPPLPPINATPASPSRSRERVR
ncbi:calcium/calmodulin-dependent protein kinase type II [Colletotrichum spaethianum]|uniref:non-specific serine/threonine protein kinase n=1 Tax=Colletotrichum spaethianum TaxID=700344 RepID=A0AA37UL77_9PEZI|nr:calcium/calmodulin-dependent protein kinase type II [Colletotrichum spaethianum]GKT52334.1 calcium/calmodulin-dependent protein kinase type II [Colletotrichum spaethianum]